MPPIVWTGFYIGAHAGYGWGDHTVFSGDGGFSSGTGDADREVSYESDGFLAGGQVGYNWQKDQLLLGLEGDLGYLGVKGDGKNLTEGGEVSDVAESEFGAYGLIGARIGLVNDRSLFYVKGGYALARLETIAGDISGPDDDRKLDEDDATFLDEPLHGYAIGAGVEYALGSNWTVKAEYLYFDFDEESSTNLQDETFTHENDLHTVKIGVNYLFSSPSYEILK